MQVSAILHCDLEGEEPDNCLAMQHASFAICRITRGQLRQRERAAPTNAAPFEPLQPWAPAPLPQASLQPWWEGLSFQIRLSQRKSKQAGGELAMPLSSPAPGPPGSA